MLKLWCPAQLPLVSGCRNSGAPPHFPHSPLHRSGLYIYIASALWNVRRILRTAPLGLRYHRALCLGRRDDRIRRISQASNIKKPTRFMGTSWIVGSDKEVRKLSQLLTITHKGWRGGQDLTKFSWFFFGSVVLAPRKDFFRFCSEVWCGSAHFKVWRGFDNKSNGRKNE